MNWTKGISIVWGVSLFMAQSARAEEQGLPQFDTSLFPEQLFWLAVTFGILYVLMKYVALPRVESTQENRKKVIEREIEAARVSNEKAKDLIIQIEKSLHEAHIRAQAHVREMIAEVTTEEDKRRTLQENEYLRHVRGIEANIAVMRESAMKDISEYAPDLSSAMVSQLLSTKG